MNKKIIIGVVAILILIILIGLLIYFKPWAKVATPVGDTTNNEVSTGENSQNETKQGETKQSEAQDNTSEKKEETTTTQEEEEKFGTILEEGDFKLEVPQVNVVKTNFEKYDQVKLGMSLDKLIEILGEASEIEEHRALNYYSWYLESNGYVKLKVSVKNDTNTISEKTLLLFSNPQLGYQISKEIGTELEDLPAKLEEVKEGMKLAEVEKILGNKHIEQSKNEFGNKVIVWFDTSENSVELTFDSKDVLTQKNVATYKG